MDIVTKDIGWIHGTASQGIAQTRRGLAGVDVDRGGHGRRGGDREGRVHRQAAEKQRGRSKSSLISVLLGVA